MVVHMIHCCTCWGTNSRGSLHSKDLLQLPIMAHRPEACSTFDCDRQVHHASTQHDAWPCACMRIASLMSNLTQQLKPLDPPALCCCLRQLQLSLCLRLLRCS